MSLYSSPQRTRLIVLAASCTALNLGAGKIAAMLSLPVYLDTIGTILGAALLPPVYAIAVGGASSLLGWVVIHPVYVFYIGTQLAIALVAIMAMRLGAFKSFWTALATGIVIALTAAIVSAPVTVLVFGGVTMPGTTAVNAVLIAAGQNLWRAVLTGSLFIESIDKTATALIAWVLLRRLPSRFLSRADE